MMEAKILIKRFAFMLLMILVCFLLQSAVFSHFELAGVTPNLLIVIAASYGFMRGSKSGIFAGFFCGLLLDISLGSYVGGYALLYMYIGYLNGLFRKVLFGDDLKLPIFLIGSSDIVYGCAIYLVLFVLRRQYDFWFYLTNIIIPEAIYTIIVSIPLYYLILRSNQRFDKSEKRRVDSFV